MEASYCVYSFCEVFRPGIAGFSAASFARSIIVPKRICEAENSGILEHLLDVC